MIETLTQRVRRADRVVIDGEVYKDRRNSKMTVGTIVETNDGLGRVAAITAASVLVELQQGITRRGWTHGKIAHDVWYVRRDVTEFVQP